MKNQKTTNQLENQYHGREILPGVIVHISETATQETIEALQELFLCAIRMVDDIDSIEAKQNQLYSDYIEARRKETSI